eukprot:197309-Chlamydomonas_euryale.AAC.1
MPGGAALGGGKLGAGRPEGEDQQIAGAKMAATLLGRLVLVLSLLLAGCAGRGSSTCYADALDLLLLR